MQLLRKYCVLELLFLILIFIFLSLIFVGHQGHLVVDCGREAYLPSEILKGKVLYKDIFNIYGPFSYQLNAFLYFIFGENLSTLYKAGIVNSLIILISIFFISKNLSTKEIAFSITLAVMVIGVFSTSIFNFIFPYSYAMAYTLSGFLLSALFLILYTKTSKEWGFVLSTFFAGISVASKYEYLPYIAFLALFVIFIKPLSKKYYFYSFISFISVPVLCFGVLFAQGLTFVDLQNSFLIIKKMVSTETLKFFYSNFVGFYPTLPTITMMTKGFFTSVIYFFSFSLLVYVLFMLKKNKLKISRWFLIVFIFLVLWKYTGYLFTKIISPQTFCWLAISNLLIFIGFCIYYLKIAGFELLKSRIFLLEFFKNIKWKDKCFMITCLIGVLSSLKSLFYLNIGVYGTFMFPVVLITNTVFASEYIPEFFAVIDKSIWKSSISIVLIIMTSLFGLTNVKIVLENKNYEVKTQKGSIFTYKEEADAHNRLIKYIQKNTKPTDKILILPEGPLLNFLTNRPSDDIYNSLIPIYVETFGEKKIIRDLLGNMPDFIFVNNRNSIDYGYAYMCRDYAFEICDFINQNYTLEETIGNDNGFAAAIYKKKN
ncbi:MAG: hypothetical protein WC197_05785 [Candidatus Gastranaerophilaceae bacterium]|jgi:hypothetical protein